MLAATLPESSENGVTKRGRGRPPIITLPLVQEVGRLIAKGMTEEQACLRVGINPNGVWSYGWKSTIIGAFTAFASARTASFDNGVPAELWELGVGQITAVFSNQS